MATPHTMPVEAVPGSIRVVEKPLGPRPAPVPEEQQSSTSPKSLEKGTEQHRTASSSSSIGSDWSFSDTDTIKRPQGVFTGEYRTRRFQKPEQRYFGPTLRIAASAEKLIMGPDSPGSTFAVTQRSNPALVEYPDTSSRFSEKEPSGAGKSSSPLRNTTLAAKTGNHGLSESFSHPRNFCRPQIALEVIPRRSSSGHELSLQRKPVNSRSLSSLFTPPGQSEHDPLVPKVPENYNLSPKDDKARTPTNITRTISRLSDGSQSVEYTTPRTAGSLETVRSFPPRASSRLPPPSTQTPPDSTVTSLVANIPASNKSQDAPPDSIEPQTLTKEPGTQGRNFVRLPDSKSTRMLDGIRSIFKSSRTADKARAKREIGTPEPQNKTQTPVTVIRLNPDENKADFSKKAVRARTSYARLSDGIVWAKNPRNPKTLQGLDPASSHLSSTPPVILPVEDGTPSFARPTQSTRTKTTVVLRAQGPNNSDIRTRRAPVVTAPTGSPQRSDRYRRSVISIQHNSSNLPHSAGSVKSNFSFKPGADHASPKDAAGNLARKLNEINSSIEMLCRRVTVETAPSQRERYLRMALSLQQQLSNYNNIDKEVTEFEILAKKKRAEKLVAENTLFDHFSQVRSQLDEE